MTRAAEAYSDSQPDPLEIEFGGRLSPRLLLKVARDLAQRDEEFAHQQSDEMTLIFKSAALSEEGYSWEATKTTGSNLNPESATSEIGENVSVPPSKIETILTFGAKRFKDAVLEEIDTDPNIEHPAERIKHRTITGYMFAIELVHEGVPLPANHAVDYLCPSPIEYNPADDDQEPGAISLRGDDDVNEDDVWEEVREITPERAIEMGKTMFWVLKQRINFSISTGFRYLDVHESRAYYDEDNNVITACCSCQDPDCDFSGTIMHEEVGEQLARMKDESGNIETDAGRTYEKVDTPDGVIYAMRPDHESLYDADNAIKLWETADAWAEIVGRLATRKDRAAQEDQQLRQAFMVISNIRTKIRKLAGVETRQR